MNELTTNNISSKIYEIRGKQVMLDSDLALLYNCKNGTKSINLAIKRNAQKFPEDFYFQLSTGEYNTLKQTRNLKFQNETSSKNTHGGIRKLPYAFTEEGVAMLASVLHTDMAAVVSVKIMRAFVLMKNYISSSLVENNYYKEMLLTHDRRISETEQEVLLLKEQFKTNNNHIFFEGQIYDAYSKILDIFNMAKNNITIIDNYIDKNMLDVISKVNVEVTLVSADKLNNIDLVKYNKQYSNFKVVVNKLFHDRFIIIDNTTLYHLGASLNSIGKKCFAITLMEDKNILNSLLKKI